MAAVLDDRLSSLLFDSITSTYRSLVESKSYSLGLAWFLYGTLRYFDLPDLVAALTPRGSWILNATSPEGLPFPETKLAAVYRRALDAYGEAGAEERFKLLVQQDHERVKIVDNWLKHA